MTKVVPILGPAGFASDLRIKADEALSNFYISQRSQSDLYRGQITSLSDLLVSYGDNPIELEVAVRDSLTKYFQRQFDQVELTISARADATGSIDLQITAILRDGENTLDIHHVVTAKDSRIRAIIDLQNEGRPFIHADMLSR